MELKIKKEAKSRLFIQFVKFCIVGVIGATFNYSIFFILYRFFNIYYIISSATGFILSIFLAFFLNKGFTFKIKENKKTKSMIIKYFLVNIFTILLVMVILRFFVEILKINIYIANFLIIGIASVSNFTGSKLFVFK